MYTHERLLISPFISRAERNPWKRKSHVPKLLDQSNTVRSYNTIKQMLTTSLDEKQFAFAYDTKPEATHATVCLRTQPQCVCVVRAGV